MKSEFHMTTKARIVRLVFGVSLLTASVALDVTWARAAQTPEDEAQKVAEAWLKLVDSGQYEESWEQAAKLFKGAVSKQQWEQAMDGARRPLGRLVSRKVKSREYMEQLPGAPDGKYVVIQFDTVFENKASAVETVTPMVDPDGAWRVSGYYIK